MANFFGRNGGRLFHDQYDTIKLVTQGMPPIMTEGARDAIVNKQPGMIIYNTDLPGDQQWDELNKVWQTI